MKFTGSPFRCGSLGDNRLKLFVIFMCFVGQMIFFRMMNLTPDAGLILGFVWKVMLTTSAGFEKLRANWVTGKLKQLSNLPFGTDFATQMSIGR